MPIIGIALKADEAIAAGMTGSDHKCIRKKGDATGDTDTLAGKKSAAWPGALWGHLPGVSSGALEAPRDCSQDCEVANEGSAHKPHPLCTALWIIAPQ
jgi:hypothetical protein